LKQLVYVTGAGRGIGQTIAVHLANQGYSVSGCARSMTQLEETQKLSGGKIRIASVDVTNPGVLKRWIDQEAAQPDTVPHGLVTAAGIYGPIGPFLENSWEDWKQGIEINLYGTTLAVRFFSEAVIKRKTPGRIVMMSGGGATKPIPNFTNYCASKAAVVRFGETIAHELKPHHITINAIAPGSVNTKLTDDLLKAGPQKAGKEMYEIAMKQKETGGTSPMKAAELTAYLMKKEAGDVTGKLLAALWDPWSSLHEMADKLNRSDIYTLRRIIPEDRPKDLQQ
jgi:NAD(P)-dependent dehydrogenase (short-subunit alcohol dehydrogenase family)